MAEGVVQSDTSGDLEDSSGNAITAADIRGLATGSAYTQTYSTASRTVANPTAAALTDNSGGTADTTVAALADGTTYANDVGAIRNNFADLTAMVNLLVADSLANRKLITALIDDLQAAGIVT